MRPKNRKIGNIYYSKNVIERRNRSNVEFVQTSDHVDEVI